METFGQRLKSLRKLKGFTQEKMAALFNVERATLAKWEIDHTIPDVSTIKRIAKYFDCSIDYLLGNESKELSEMLPEIKAFAEKLSQLPLERRQELLRLGNELFKLLNKENIDK